MIYGDYKNAPVVFCLKKYLKKSEKKFLLKRSYPYLCPPKKGA